VLYLGPDVPEASWLTAVNGHRADAAVLCVITNPDRRHADRVTRSLRTQHPELLIASGGASGTALSGGAQALPFRIGDASHTLDRLLKPQDGDGRSPH
jgi:hypothetical protein